MGNRLIPKRDYYHFIKSVIKLSISIAYASSHVIMQFRAHLSTVIFLSSLKRNSCRQECFSFVADSSKALLQENRKGVGVLSLSL